MLVATCVTARATVSAGESNGACSAVVVPGGMGTPAASAAYAAPGRASATHTTSAASAPRRRGSCRDATTLVIHVRHRQREGRALPLVRRRRGESSSHAFEARIGAVL